MANEWHTASGRTRNRKPRAGGYGNGGYVSNGFGANGHKGNNGGKGGAKGQGKGGTGGKAGGTAKPPSYPDWNVPRGTLVECPDPECTRTGQYADTAGWACPKCGTNYRWGEVWDQLHKDATKKAADTEQAGGTGAAAADKKKEEPAEDAKAGAAKRGGARGGKDNQAEPDEMANTQAAVEEARTAWDKAEAKLGRERTDFSSMDQRLARILDELDEQTARMDTKRKVIVAAHADATAAKTLYSNRVADREAAAQAQLVGISGNLNAAIDRSAVARRTAKALQEGKAAEWTSRLDKLQAEATRVAKAKEERASKAKAAKEAAEKAAEEAEQLAKEVDELETADTAAKEAVLQAETTGPKDEEAVAPEANVASFAQSFAELANADVIDSDSEDEMSNGCRDLDPDGWLQEVAEWAFYAEADDEPDAELVGWFVSWEKDDETTTQLEELLQKARDKFLEARQGAAGDAAIAKQVEDSGNTWDAQQMQAASKVYSETRYKGIRDELVAHLRQGMDLLWKQRQAKLDEGKQQAPKALRYKVTHANKPVAPTKAGAKDGVKKDGKKRNTNTTAGAAKTAKDKAKASLDVAGLQLVSGGTATAAAAGC